jgi:RNA recognition motif-containing protein
VIDPRKAKSKTNSKKIFVGGVDSNVSEDELKEYFSRFGKVDGIELPFDKIRNRRREFCFIIFDTKEAADTACTEAKQFIGGRECDIKRAQPQNNGPNRRGGHAGGPPGAGGFGGHQQQLGYQSYGNGGWGQPAPYPGNGQGYAAPAPGGWSNGRQQSQGGRGGGAGGNGGGRTFHRPRVYTGSGSEGGFNGFG